MLSEENSQGDSLKEMHMSKDRYYPLIGTLGYILSPDQNRVLMIHRNKRENDPHLGKYNGLGGKLDRGEDIITGMKREIMEEAGIEPIEMKLRGTINWKGFGGDDTGSFGFIFLVTKYQGDVLSTNPEGDLDWHDVNTIMDLKMWEGDRHFLPLVFDDDHRVFHGIMPYSGEKPLSWSYVRE